MANVLSIGAGKIGTAIVELLRGSGDFHVTVADTNPRAEARAKGPPAEHVALDANSHGDVVKALQGQDMVVSACPHAVNATIAAAAAEARVHYFDLTEDLETTRRVREISQNAASAFVPQCGLAPGFIAIAAHDLAKKFDSLERVQMRVGALPQFPTNRLKYNLTWSTDGLINEYCNPCEIIYQGERRESLPLEGLENFSLDGINYEAFNTSGGLGTLCETLDGKVRDLDYKTVRYPGHRDLIRLLTGDLRLCDRREVFKDVLESAVPSTMQDLVLIFVTITGNRDGNLMQESFVRKIYASEINGKMWSAIQITTAAGICTMVDLMREGKLPKNGFVRQEQVSLKDFVSNRFSQYYS